MKTDPHTAVLLAIADTALQRYMQQYPYGKGPDEARNRCCLDSLRKAIRLRPVLTPAPQPAEGTVTLSGDEHRRIVQLFTQFGTPQRHLPAVVNDYAWRVKPIRSDAASVLSIGCGAGSELVALRAMLPAARIDAIDWTQKISPPWMLIRDSHTSARCCGCWRHPNKSALKTWTSWTWAIPGRPTWRTSPPRFCMRDSTTSNCCSDLVMYHD